MTTPRVSDEMLNHDLAEIAYRKECGMRRISKMKEWYAKDLQDARQRITELEQELTKVRAWE